ncbi:MAG: Gldg family protein [Chloroflexi bacterium]|nr:Gldg family protein [Chloroflexota bacterium]MCL5275189.1 Gldg family protein [Chloroflexota bacterium]
MKPILAIMRKELKGYFGSPMALIFIGTFLAASLFTFFWVDAFFARGIADVRPLFLRMPILLIFLVAALTMRQWSEEQRSGTLEMLLTLPVQHARLVIGKFLSVIILAAIALALTLPLVITVAILGNLDFGPVIGGYIAALLLASSYAAIGLFVSSRTDNQIVALIVTLIIGGLFYLVGSAALTDFVGGQVGDILRAIGTGSRFESIERGVIDIRDLIYYATLTALFLVLNTLSLDRKRWSTGDRTLTYRRNMNLTGGLVALNLVALNIWVAPLTGLRADLTEQHQFSLSPATINLLTSLQEPLLIRAYISQNTHPLLAPLVPQVRDMLSEYQIASGGKVTAEVVDPSQDTAAAAEASQTYGIQPTPLQVAGRYETSVINTYFDILVRYGDQNTVLNFRDLIQVTPQRDGSADVQFRNLEYDLTSAVKKVAYGFQSIDSVFASIKDPIQFYIIDTPNSLPQSLKDTPAIIEKVANDIKAHSSGKFTVQVVNPDDPNSAFTRSTLQQQFSLQPTPVSLFSDQTYYLNMLMVIGGKGQLIYPSGDFSEASVRTAIESALKRTTSGFLKVVGVWTPPQVAQNPYSQGGGGTESFQSIMDQLKQNYSVQTVDLSTGQVPPNIDSLLVIGPSDMTDKERYAIDQYLMSGGSVIVAAGNYTIAPSQTGISLQPVQNGLDDMLASYGITVSNALVLDTQNEPFPSQVSRDVNGATVREIQALNYPFFVDVRPDAMDTASPIVSRLPAVTLNWVSPVELDAVRNASRKSEVLLHSSAQSWLRTNIDIQPNYQAYPNIGFAVEGQPQSYPLAVAVQGVFDSYFKGKPSPLEVKPTAAPAASPASATATPEPILPSSAINQSPDTARLVVIGSTEFLNDLILQLSSQLSQDRYLNSLQLVQNAVDWSVEDLDLLSIRARGTTTHVLQPLTGNQRTFWEVLNYVVALSALIGIAVVWRLRQRAELPMNLSSVGAEASSAEA